MNKLSKKILLAWLDAACIVSCTKEQPENLPEVQLGKQLENPYSVENMKKAYQNLMEKKENEGTDNARIIEDSLDIEVTDYYVKFLVENDDQVNLLLSDSLNLSFFPLDVELDDNLVDTMIIAPHTKSLGIDEFYFFSLPGNNDSNYIKNSISIYDTNDFEECKFQMYLGEELINEWSPPTGSFGDSINSPFNYDSWEASAYDEVVETSGWEFIHGELIFTITNEDLE